MNRRMIKALVLVALMANLSLAVSSCSSAPTGVVDGTLTLRGAGKYDRPNPVPGTVRLLSAHGHIDVVVGKTGRFAARVPVGHYEVEAGLGQPYNFRMGSCGAYGPVAHGETWGSVNLTKGEHVSVRVQCAMF